MTAASVPHGKNFFGCAVGDGIGVQGEVDQVGVGGIDITFDQGRAAVLGERLGAAFLPGGPILFLCRFGLPEYLRADVDGEGVGTRGALAIAGRSRAPPRECRRASWRLHLFAAPLRRPEESTPKAIATSTIVNAVAGERRRQPATWLGRGLFKRGGPRCLAAHGPPDKPQPLTASAAFDSSSARAGRLKSHRPLRREEMRRGSRLFLAQ